MAWTNADGLQVRFASDWRSNALRKNRPGTLSTMGAIKTIELDYDLAAFPAGVNYSADLNNDGTLDGFYTGDVHLPAYASIVDVYVVATETAVGGTSLAVGTFTKAGAAIDADGMVTAATAITANLAAGKRVLGVGADTAATAGTSSIGAADGYIGLTTVGTFTAGKGRIVINYIEAAA